MFFFFAISIRCFWDIDIPALLFSLTFHVFLFTPSHFVSYVGDLPLLQNSHGTNIKGRESIFTYLAQHVRFKIKITPEE